MVNYRRNWLPGGTFFFTVALSDRSANTLTANVSLLRTAFRKARQERPFTMDAIVVLPDHLHAILTLPENNTDYAHRWRRVKSIFTHALIHEGASFEPRDKTGVNLWQRRYWEHTIRDTTDLAHHVA